LTEAEWVEQMAQDIRRARLGQTPSLSVQTGLRVPYGYEIRSYGEDLKPSSISFQTDLAIVETDERGQWKPRVVIEAKIRRINTHDCITYSHKAASHKAVHPYLRYGIMLGEREHYPLPGRLYRHGLNFDFMISFSSTKPTRAEKRRFLELLRAEIEASRAVEKIIYESRSKSRDHYTMLHRRLHLE